MSYTFRDLTIEVLEKAGIPLSSDEIWEHARDMGSDKKVGSVGKTPDRTIGALIYMDIQDNREKSTFVTAGARPTRFTLRKLMTRQAAEKSIEEAPPKPEPPVTYMERDIHSLLAYFADRYLHASTKTINHSKSSKKDFGEWVHPDMVGCHFPFMEWDDRVYQLATAIGDVSILLFSFELKKQLGFGNLREAFFQAVSNSSWANVGYLVAAKISINVEFHDELQRLSSYFGIGVISLDTDNPDSSEILFPAKIKEFLDWTTIDKLSKKNQDFEAFLERVQKDVKGKEVRKDHYDKVYSAEELIAKFRKKE